MSSVLCKREKGFLVASKPGDLELFKQKSVSNNLNAKRERVLTEVVGGLYQSALSSACVLCLRRENMLTP